MAASTPGHAFTSLQLAALGGKVNSTNTLLLAGADVNTHRIANNNTPLYIALTHGHLEVAENLLCFGADANIKNTNGTYPIHLAVCNGCDEMVAKLL